MGRTIRLLRHRQGWNQEDVARKLAISVPAYSKIESGVTDMNLSRLAQLAGVFGFSVVDLLSLDEEAERPVQANAIQAVREQITEREAEVIQLQKKVIDLYQQLRITGPRAYHAVAADTFAGSR